jgi:hypothetical protein
VPVYDYQGYREWGKFDLGTASCDFVNSDCSSLANTVASGKFFCPSQGTTFKCTNYRSPTYCSAGGSVAPGCNLWTADGRYRPNLCSDTNLPTAKGFSGFDSDYTAAGFRIASDSRCIDLGTSLKTTSDAGITTISSGYACYPMRCTGGKLFVKVNTEDVECSFGTTVDLAGKGGLTEGSIKCACCIATPAVPRPRTSSRWGPPPPPRTLSAVRSTAT